MTREVSLYYQDHDRVATTTPSRTGRQQMVDLGLSYCPRDNDVVCSRENRALKHTGNIRLRSLVESKVEEFSACQSQQRRSDIVTEVVAIIRSRNPRGGFVRCINNRWVEVGEQIARETTSQMFRDCVNMYRQRELKAKDNSRRFRSFRGRSASPTCTINPQQYTASKHSSEESVSTILRRDDQSIPVDRDRKRRKLEDATDSEVQRQSGERTKHDGTAATRSAMIKPASKLESVLWKAIDDVLPPADLAALHKLSVIQLQLIRRLSVEEALPGGDTPQNGKAD